MDFEKYRNQLPYPSREDYQTVYYYKAGKVVHTLKAGDPSPLPNETKGAMREVVLDSEGFTKARDAYHAESAALTKQFYADVKEDLGITNNPKADLLMSKAWEMGHSSGLSEVYGYASDLVGLIE